jgi:hypothetical protein
MSSSEPIIRLYERQGDGKILDRQLEFSLKDFAGHCPAIGDVIVDSFVAREAARDEPANRILQTVVGRVFNPRDLEGYIALIVEERKPTAEEMEFVAG